MHIRVDLLDLFSGCSPTLDSTTMVISHWRSLKPPVQSPKLTISTVPVRQLWPGGPLESCCWSSAYIGILKRGCCSNRTDELASEREASRQNAKVSSSLSFSLGCHQKVLARFSVVGRGLRNLGFYSVDSRRSQTDTQD